MTVTLKSKHIGNYYVVIELDKTGIYGVQICETHDFGKTYGYPIRKMNYRNEDKAKQCYYRYCGVAKKWNKS